MYSLKLCGRLSVQNAAIQAVFHYFFCRSKTLAVYIVGVFVDKEAQGEAIRHFHISGRGFLMWLFFTVHLATCVSVLPPCEMYVPACHNLPGFNGQAFGAICLV